MLRFISRSAAPRASIIRSVQIRGMADQRIEDAAEAAGKAKDSSPKVGSSPYIFMTLRGSLFRLSHRTDKITNLQSSSHRSHL